ncbi:orotidine-5'-phosphate decarboxylase [bacterium]|nr:orotidine-5'-phosphate decarboxylase [bacterium]|tara:strand:- start:347 stop:1150 length:804 start_codon:yes stop_codon:yes gene_type:complete
MNHPLIHRWKSLQSKTNTCLCIGLDPDITQLPSGYSSNVTGLSHFLKDIIDASITQCIAYKPNISFFEAYGIEGLTILSDIIKHIDQTVPVIIDGKRGDIGNTSAMQAKYIFDYFNADATTLHPYMGLDSLEPFFNYQDKFHFVLGLTSNPGSKDFETLPLKTNTTLATTVIQTLSHWNKTYQNIGVVVGATDNKLTEARNINPDLLFLIPGVGKQGGTYETAYNAGKNLADLALINVSRGISGAVKHKQSIKEDINHAIQVILKPL